MIMRNWCAFVVAALYISGCASTGDNIVPDAIGQKPVSYLKLSCGGEYDFSQDCSNFNGAQRAVLIDGIECRVAGSSDGKTILLQGIAKYLPSQKTREVEVNECFAVVKQVLIDDGLDLIRTLPVGKNGSLMAYIVEFNSDAYALLTSSTN